LLFWGGYDMMNQEPFITYAKEYSTKQERLYQIFLLASHIYFCYTGENYCPDKVFDAYKVVFPPEFYTFGTKQDVPKFAIYG